jgi:hypothetical protein
MPNIVRHNAPDSYDHISDADFNTAIHSQNPREVFPGRTLASAIVSARRLNPVTYDVDLEFKFDIRVDDLKSRHTVWKRIGYAVTREAADELQRLISNASKNDLMFAALDSGWIDIQEVFGATSDDHEEGSGNWFARHGIPANAEIIRIYKVELTRRQLS